MKYSIMGFYQPAIIKLNEEGHNIDVTDLLILRWFVDFSHSEKMIRITEGANTYYWVKYQSILDDLPILKIGKRMLALRLQKMADAGILTSYVKKEGGVFTMYGFGHRYQSLISDEKECNQKDHVAQDISGGVKILTEVCKNIDNPSANKLADPLTINLQTKNPSTNNPSMKDPSTRISLTSTENESDKITKPTSRKTKEIALTPSIEELQGIFGKPVGTEMAEWFEHKTQRRDTYTPKGLEKLLSIVHKNVKAYGEQAVVGLIELSIANGWQGIAWDRLKQQKPSKQQNTPPPQSGNVFVDMLRKSEEEGVDPF